LFVTLVIQSWPFSLFRIFHFCIQEIARKMPHPHPHAAPTFSDRKKLCR
jgi:hypothetical protein